ncbi:tight junction-associated protein 1 isoform X1 [Patella vulgata]|uniref:tight junction-associated protein 1 isoform X1 n=1 Tax=Patella vulgata TaxID=6465 RepID=UPI0021804F5B|nr:tight junction-associated protein 1 isoform X1 [Patella vulgata]
MDLKHNHRRAGSEVIIPSMAYTCKECGCQCKTCASSSLDLHQQIEELQSHLVRSNNHISQVEHELLDSKQIADWELLKLTDEFAKLRDRYDRLLDSHKRMQKVNNELEDKLLRVVNKFETEKTDLQRELASTTSKLVDAKLTICDLEDENERYRKDCNMAVQLLQCKPSNFIAHKLDCLPIDLQDRVKKHLSSEQKINMENSSAKESKLIRVPIATFPPTAMVYSVNNLQTKSDVELGLERGNNGETVPMTLIAKVLTQPDPKHKPQRTYICWKCKKDVVNIDKEVQVNTVKDSDSNSASRFWRQNDNRPRLDSTETEI